MNGVKYDCVFSSPQIRAIQTAEVVSGMKATIDARLDVFDLGEADLLHREDVIMSGSTPDPAIYQGVEDVNCYIKRVFQFMGELESIYGDNQLNILLSGHRYTTGCMGAYFLGVPEDGNLLKFDSANGKSKTYQFASKETVYNS